MVSGGGHAAWTGWGEDLLKGRGGVSTLLSPSYFYIVGIPSHVNIFLVDKEYILHCHLPENKKTCEKKYFELKGGPVNDMQLFMFDTSRCVEHRYNRHPKKEEYINMSTVHRMFRFTTSLCVADPIQGVCCYSYTLPKILQNVRHRKVDRFSKT